LSGRAATINVICGAYALSVGRSEMPAPKGWRWVTLTDVARLESGHTPSREHSEYWDGGIPWIGIKDARLHHGGKIAQTLQTVSQAGLDNSAARLLPAGTVCLSRTASVGYVVVTDREMATSQDFVNWVCGPEIDPSFLQQLLIAENESLFRFGKGSTHTTIYYPEVKAFNVCLPPLNEQRRIVAKLEALQAHSRRAREALDAVPPLLEKLRQSILAAAFRGDLTKDWRATHKNIEPATELLKRIRTERRRKWEESELGKMKAKGRTPTDDSWKAKYQEPATPDSSDLPRLPTAWCWATVEELATKVVDGVHKKPNYVSHGVPFLTVKNLTAGPGISFETVNYVSPQDHEEFTKRTDPERGDLLISKDGTLGVTRLVTTDAVFSIFVSLALVKPVLRDMGGYLEGALSSPIFQERFKATGSGLLHIHLVDLRAAVLPICSLAEQREIAVRVDVALHRLDAVAARVATMEENSAALGRAVLAKAFRGELVTQDPNDQTAEVRLEPLASTNGSVSTNGASPKRGRVQNASLPKSRGDQSTQGLKRLS
jgi:type I restriction enzyme, S subunit